MPFYCIASKSFAIYSGKSLNQPIVWTFLSHSSSCYSSALFRSSPLEMCWPLFAISVHVLQNVILIQSDLILEHRFVFYVFSLSLSLSLILFSCSGLYVCGFVSVSFHHRNQKVTQSLRTRASSAWFAHFHHIDCNHHNR